MLHDESYDFSFSGIKTSVLYYLRDHPEVLEANFNDIAASFQRAVVDVLVAKTLRVASELGVRDIIAVGGVSANSELRTRFTEACRKHSQRFFSPRPLFSTDNAAMIAMLGSLKLARGKFSPFSLKAEARVPLTDILA
jgi:N6-L-threonylcarbamoyladenine synthase